MKCLNIKSPEFITLYNKTTVHPLKLLMMVNKYFSDNPDVEEMPTTTQLGLTAKDLKQSVTKVDEHLLSLMQDGFISYKNNEIEYKGTIYSKKGFLKTMYGLSVSDNAEGSINPVAYFSVRKGTANNLLTALDGYISTQEELNQYFKTYVDNSPNVFDAIRNNDAFVEYVKGIIGEQKETLQVDLVKPLTSEKISVLQSKIDKVFFNQLVESGKYQVSDMTVDYENTRKLEYADFEKLTSGKLELELSKNGYITEVYEEISTMFEEYIQEADDLDYDYYIDDIKSFFESYYNPELPEDQIKAFEKRINALAELVPEIANFKNGRGNLGQLSLFDENEMPQQQNLEPYNIDQALANSQRLFQQLIDVAFKDLFNKPGLIDNYRVYYDVEVEGLGDVRKERKLKPTDKIKLIVDENGAEYYAIELDQPDAIDKLIGGIGYTDILLKVANDKRIYVDVAPIVLDRMDKLFLDKKGLELVGYDDFVNKIYDIYGDNEGNGKDVVKAIGEKIPEFNRIVNNVGELDEQQEKQEQQQQQPQQQQQQEIKPGVQELFNSNLELANQVYEALGFMSITLPEKLSYKTGKIYNAAGKEIFAGIVDGQVYINKELIDKYTNKEILDNQKPILNSILKNLNVYDRLINLPREQFINFLVAHEQAHLDFEKEGKRFRTEDIEEAYVNARALITVGILKSKEFDLGDTNEAAARLERYFPTKEQYIDDITELVAKKMDNVRVSLSTMTGYKVDVFEGSLWGKKLATSSMDDFYFLQGKDGYPKNKKELKEAISKDIARNIPNSIKEKYWREILESLPDDEKALLSNWAYYNDYKRYTRQYGQPTFDFNEMRYPELHKEGEKKYTNWTSFINGLFTSFDGPSRDLWFANPLISDTEDSIVNWYKNLTPEKLDEYISNLSRAMAFKSMVVASFEGGSNISALDSGARKVEDLQKAYYEIKQRTEISPIQIESKNEQITPQQKQQALQLYSQYLDTIFPDSKVKDIVYHGTLPQNKFEKFDKQKGTNLSGEYGGIHFGDLTAAIERPTKIVQTENFLVGIEEDLSNFKPNIIPAILNINNIKRVEEGKNWGQGDWSKLISKEKKVDGFVYTNKIENKGQDSYVVFEPEQIHILGSKQDIEGFKDFIKQKSQQQQQQQQPVTESKKPMSFGELMQLPQVNNRVNLYLKENPNMKVNEIINKLIIDGIINKDCTI